MSSSPTALRVSRVFSVSAGRLLARDQKLRFLVRRFHQNGRLGHLWQRVALPHLAAALGSGTLCTCCDDTGWTYRSCHLFWWLSCFLQCGSLANVTSWCEVLVTILTVARLRTLGHIESTDHLSIQTQVCTNVRWCRHEWLFVGQFKLPYITVFVISSVNYNWKKN